MQRKTRSTSLATLARMEIDRLFKHFAHEFLQLNESRVGHRRSNNRYKKCHWCQTWKNYPSIIWAWCHVEDYEIKYENIGSTHPISILYEVFYLVWLLLTWKGIDSMRISISHGWDHFITVWNCCFIVF